MEPITSTTTLTPTTQRQGVPVTTRPFKITDIPDAMDKMNWPVAAALMRHWFNGKPWPDTVDGGMSEVVKRHDAWPGQEYIEESIVRMDWLSNYDQVKEAVRFLRAHWLSPNAQRYLGEKLRGKFSGTTDGHYPVIFGGRGSCAEKFGRFNTVGVGFSSFDTASLSDLRGALANFNMRVAGEGVVTIRGSVIVFRVTRLAFYAEDSYDFNDSSMWYTQPLGFWNRDGIAKGLWDAFLTNVGIDSAVRSKPPVLSDFQSSISGDYADLYGQRFFLVTNSMFQRYRASQRRGGTLECFLIFIMSRCLGLLT